MPTTVNNQELLATNYGPATDPEPSAGNEPVQWLPGAFNFKLTATAIPPASEDALWADLSAHARASWAKENPFE